MRRLLVCLLLLTSLGAACSSGGGDDEDDASEPTGTEAPSDDSAAYCALVEEVMTLFEENVDPDLPPEEARAAFVTEFEDEVVALFVESGGIAPSEISGEIAAVVNSSENSEEAQAEIAAFNQEECGLDTSVLTGALD